MATPFDIALAYCPAFTPIIGNRMREIFTSAEDFFRASANTLHEQKFRKEFIERFLLWRQTIRPNALLDVLRARNIQCVSFYDPEYPPLLRHIHDPPHILFVQGRMHAKPACAVVGSRKATPYGIQVTKEIVDNLCKQGVMMVSGLAPGIDTTAHEAAIRAGAPTIAVLAGGHQAGISQTQQLLMQAILKNNGTLISEHPPHIAPNRFHFPRRNRLIAGIAKATLVVEAAQKSGSLITAYCAVHENRDVYVIPGPITSKTSEGTNLLIRQGARPCLTADDILDSFPDLKEKKKLTVNSTLQNAENSASLSIASFRKEGSGMPNPLGHSPMGEPGEAYTAITSTSSPTPLTPLPPLSPSLTTLLSHLSSTPIHSDDLCDKIPLTSDKILGGLSTLELMGYVQMIGGMYYVPTRPPV